VRGGVRSPAFAEPASAWVRQGDYDGQAPNRSGVAVSIGYEMVRRRGKSEGIAMGVRALATAVMPMGATKCSAPEPHYLYPHVDLFVGF